MSFAVKLVTALVLLAIPVELKVFRPHFIVSSVLQRPPSHDKVCPCPDALCVPVCPNLGVNAVIPSVGAYAAKVYSPLKDRKCDPGEDEDMKDVHHFCCRPNLDYTFRSAAGSQQEAGLETPANDESTPETTPTVDVPPSSTQSRIFKGFQSTPAERFNSSIKANPWFATIIFTGKNGRSSHCAGVLIGPRYVLTVASCYYYDQELLRVKEIRFGEKVFNGTADVIAFAEKSIIHADYGRFGMNYNIALIKTTEIIPYSTRAYPLRLPPSGVESYELSDVWVQATGWEEEKNSSFHRVMYTIDLQIKTDCCEHLYRSNFNSNKQLCLMGYDYWELCDGDAGTPITVWTTKGAVLLALASYADGKCGDGGAGSGTFVPAMMPWIENTIWMLGN